jgi:hypothetical protein
MAQFSDPAWWPKPPPRPPVHISLPTILLRSLIPLGVIAVVVTLVLTQTGSGPATVRSVTAFESCLSLHGAHTSAGAQVDVTRAAVHACEGLLPPGVAVGSLTSPGAAAATASIRVRVLQCLQEALASLPHDGRGGGRFGRGPSPAARAALTVCETLVGSSSGGAGAGAGRAPPDSAPKM